MRSAPFVLLPVLAGCGHPDAPKSLDELCAYLYEHYEDEDTDEMEAGLANLYTWLHREGNLESTFEGYTLTETLSEDLVKGLKGRQHSARNAAGAAVGTSSKKHRLNAILDTLILVDPVLLSPGMYASYTRHYLSDPECFLDRECETLELYNEMVTTYALGVEIGTKTNAQYRWFNWEDRQVVVQRTWLDEGAEINKDWLSVSDQYYLNIIFPEGRGTLRLQSTWIVAQLGNASVPEDVAISLVISSMQSVYEDIEAWIDAH
jgi:hypothetical protein